MTPQPQIEILSLGELQTNCYLVWDSETREACIIDPADDGAFISQRVLELDLSPQAIIFTHGHFDHVLASLELKLNFGVPIYMHSADDFLLAQAQSSAHHWLKRSVDPVPPADKPLRQDQVLMLGDISFQVIETPGHTPGSICLYAETDTFPVLFSGDTLFHEGVGRTDFRYSNPQQLHDSLRKLCRLPEHSVCHPGHGHITTIRDVKSFLEL